MINSDEVVIKVENVNKTFRLPHERTSSIKNALITGWRKSRTYEKQQALNDITFEIKKGEFFGIVGRNGSGKSTLLKLLAGIYSPSKGDIHINGTLTPFIELGVGFNPELTGRENVYLNGALLGFNRKQMQAMYKDIVDFAEIERFMDQKLKNYSSGMQVRLAFSIAIRAESDILLIDEVLAVGDAAFQKKCFNYFDKLKRESKTVVFVTHDMSTFEKYCDNGILIDMGKIVFSGQPLLLSAEYKMLNVSDQKKNLGKEEVLSFDQSIEEVLLNNGNKVTLAKDDELVVDIRVIPKETSLTTAGISIINNDGIFVAFHNSLKEIGKKKLKKNQTYNFRYKLQAGQFMPGAYSVDVALYDNNQNYIDLKSNAGKFAVVGKEDTKSGILKLEGKWDFSD